MSYEIGAHVGDYEILQVLGAGGMGKVFKVRNVISDRVEAMKVLLPDLSGNTELADRFIREIKVQAALSHPNIAALHTALKIDNQLVMLMEYVEGVTLGGLIQKGRLPVPEMTGYIMQALDALGYAHGKGVIHRDLKPTNMMVTPDGVLKLLDFGIAKLASQSQLTKTGLTVGSIYYMSPEQIQGASDLDARADLYSFGICMYELYTATRPFEGDSEFSIMSAHLQQVPMPPIQRDPQLPRPINDIILMAIEKDPAKRWASAGAMLAALRGVAKDLGQAHGMALPATSPAAIPPPPPPPPPPAMQPQPYGAAPAPPAAVQSARQPSSRRGLYIALGSLVTVAILVVGGIQLPKLMKTQAQQQGQEAPVTPPQEEPKASQPAASAEVPQDVATPVAGAAGRPNAPAGGSTAVRTAGGAPVSSAPRGGGTSMAAEPQSSPQSSPQPMAGQPPAAAQNQQTQQAAPPVKAESEGASQAALEEVREHLMLLGTRVGAVKHSIDNLRAEQARMGLGLRPDITASVQRMEYHMDQTEAALKRGDQAAAKRSLSNAERETAKLESFLGR